MLRFVRLLVVLVAVLVGGLGAVSAFPSAAAALGPGCYLEKVQVGPTVTWVERCPGTGGTPGGSDSGGGPSCTLSGLNSFCMGAAPCWMNYPAAVDPTAAEVAAKPSETAVWVYRRCNDDANDPLSGWFWQEDVGPTPEQMAQDAYGQLAAPAFSAETNPPGKSVVGLPTWFWAATANPGEISGTSLTVTAVAEPSHLEVNLGNGSGVRQCPWSTTESATCAQTYTRSSAGQPVGSSGLPAYTAQMRLVYDVHFEQNGAPLTLPGLPTVFSSAWVSTQVPVAEVQSLVTQGP